MQSLLVMTFLLAAALTAARAPRPESAAGDSQQSQPAGAGANLSSNQRQQLRRHNPQMQYTEQSFGQEKLNVGLEWGIPQPTAQALIKYVTQNHRLALLALSVSKLPGSADQYFVLGTIYKDGQAQERFESQTLMLVLREQGGAVSEVSRSENDSGAPGKEAVFFVGQDRLLIVVSHTVEGSLFAGDYAYEYAGNNLKPLGEFAVVEKLGMSGSVWLTRSPLINNATAEFANNAYRVTMRGAKGALYEHAGDGTDSWKKVAAPKSAITYSYDGTNWRPAIARQAGRK